VLEVFEIGFVLGYEPIQEAQHIAFNVGVGVLVDREAAGGMLDKKYADPVLDADGRDPFGDLIGKLDHFFASRRNDPQLVRSLHLIEYISMAANPAHTFAEVPPAADKIESCKNQKGEV